MGSRVAAQYLAAMLAERWAARHEAHPIGLFESESNIWRLSRKEQEEVWEYCCCSTAKLALRVS